MKVSLNVFQRTPFLHWLRVRHSLLGLAMFNRHFGARFVIERYFHRHGMDRKVQVGP